MIWLAFDGETGNYEGIVRVKGTGSEPVTVIYGTAAMDWPREELILLDEAAIQAAMVDLTRLRQEPKD